MKVIDFNKDKQEQENLLQRLEQCKEKIEKEGYTQGIFIAFDRNGHEGFYIRYCDHNFAAIGWLEQVKSTFLETVYVKEETDE